MFSPFAFFQVKLASGRLSPPKMSCHSRVDSAISLAVGEPARRRISAMSLCTISFCNAPSATSRGVQPSLDTALGSAPAFSNNLTISSLPLNAAKCSGVASLCSFALGSAPAFSNNLTAFAVPENTALCSGVSPTEFAAFESAPALSNNLTDSALPLLAAQCNGVLSCLSFAFGSAPLSSSSRTSEAVAFSQKLSLSKVRVASALSSGVGSYVSHASKNAPAMSNREGRATAKELARVLR